MRDTFHSLADNFLVYLYDIRGYSELSIVTYDIALRQMIRVSHISEESEQQYIVDMTPFRFAIVRNTKRTISKKLSAVRSFVHYLEDICDMKIKLIGDTSIKVTPTLPKPIEEHYIEEVLNEANLQERVLLCMLYGLGLRISELSHLKLDDIQKEWIRVNGKGNKIRELPLLATIYPLIEAYIKNENPRIYLFEKGNAPMNTAQLRYRLGKVFQRQGLKATPHQLRHSFATHLLNNGARIADVSELLGHKTMATTQVYTKLGTAKKMQDYMKAHPLATS
jgi:integrase/recombinase XerC